VVAKFGSDDSGSCKDPVFFKSSTKVCSSRADCFGSATSPRFRGDSIDKTTTMQILTGLKKVGAWFAPPPAAAADGRDQWPSRASFLLAAMGGCAGSLLYYWNLSTLS
jgi:hypothetical protein